MLNLGISEISIAKATELFDRFIPDELSHAATSFVESLKINSITENAFAYANGVCASSSVC